jgi:hypothetical protein
MVAMEPMMQAARAQFLFSVPMFKFVPLHEGRRAREQNEVQRSKPVCVWEHLKSSSSSKL